jgi:hypothetical protein
VEKPSIAPLLTVLLVWMMVLAQPAPAVPVEEPEAGIGSGVLPRLAAPGYGLAPVAEAGSCPEPGPSRVTTSPRACVAADRVGHVSVTRPGAIPLPVESHAAGADHTPLYFGSLPPPLLRRFVLLLRPSTPGSGASRSLLTIREAECFPST